jgi:hypothetical protein
MKAGSPPMVRLGATGFSVPYRQSDGEGGMKHSREEDCEVEG